MAVDEAVQESQVKLLPSDPASGGNVTLDRAHESDREQVTELFREAFQINHPGGDWRKIRRAVGIELAKAFADQRSLAAPVILVARSLEGDFLGYIWWKYDVGPDGAMEAFVQGIGVKKEHRSRGVGTLLVSAMVQWVHRNLSALTKRVERVSCAVSPRNGPVLKVIEKLGGQVKYVVCSKDIQPMEVP